MPTFKSVALAFFILPAPLLAQDQPIPLVPETPTWDSFHGQLNAQKYSPLDQITAENVGGCKSDRGHLSLVVFH